MTNKYKTRRAVSL